MRERHRIKCQGFSMHTGSWLETFLLAAALKHDQLELGLSQKLLVPMDTSIAARKIKP